MKKPEEKIQKILDDNNLKLGYEITFPDNKQIPEEVQLALSVLNRHGMKILITLNPKK